MGAIQMFPYQEEGARWLSQRRRALLLDAPGLGKTIQLIKAAEYAGQERLDAVCPASVRLQWLSVMSTNSSAARKRAYSYNFARDKGLPPRMDALVLDELHALKSRNSQRTRAILGTQAGGVDGLIADAECVWGATGTPMPKDASDLYSLMLAIVPKSLYDRRCGGTLDYWAFLKRYTDYYHGDYGIVVKGHKNQDELKDRLAPFMLRRLKRDVLKDWTKPIVDEVLFEVGKGLKALLAMEAEGEGYLVAKTVKRHGIEGLANLTDHSATLRRFTGMLLIGPVTEWLTDKLDNGEKKIVVVCFHREVMEGIQAGLKKKGYEAVMYRGGMTEAAKDTAKKQFIESKKCAVMLLQIIAGGTGLDGLQHVASRMLMAEYSWIPTDNEQAMGRIDRIGQKNPVLVEFAGIADSLHGKITSAFTRRARDNEEIFGI